jgi:hypothetical protein
MKSLDIMQCLFNKQKKTSQSLTNLHTIPKRAEGCVGLEYMEKMKGSSKIMLALTLSFGHMIMDNLIAYGRLSSN